MRRPLLLLALTLPLSLAACESPATHDDAARPPVDAWAPGDGCSCIELDAPPPYREDGGGAVEDAPPLSDGGGCVGVATFACSESCSSDALEVPICVEGAWACPPGTLDRSTCPPTCVGPPPPGCVCDVSGDAPRWDCDPHGCGDDVSAGGSCEEEGASCGTIGPCGGQRCECTEGRWTCLIAEPGPSCFCGPETTAGTPCPFVGQVCGECGGGATTILTCEEGGWATTPCGPRP